MKGTTHLIKVNIAGGVISAGDLYEILIIARNAGATQIRFGNRQQLYFSIGQTKLEDLEFDMLSAEISYEVDGDNYPNIMSSYVADAIFNFENWLKEGVYKDIFDLFNFKPSLKVNLVDSSQTFTPYFTGNLNFISSAVSNYWYLYVRFPKTNMLYCWPSLVYSDDIPGISKKTEEVILANKDKFYDQPAIDGLLLHQMVTHKSDFVSQQADKALKIPDFHLPYYEGFNKYGNKYWLGIYRRDELFLIDFLVDICSACMQTRVGQLYITPWKSVLVKGIELADRDLWGNILNKYQINIRHAANEMNWQIEDMCDSCLDLKRELVRDFEEADLRTYRLTFAIKRQPKTGLAGSIIIKAKKERFDISHTKDFNPNSKEFINYRQDVGRQQLSQVLMRLCSDFYSWQASTNQSITLNTADTVADEEITTVFRCKNCLGVYDETFGDIQNAIPAGTPFETLTNYSCPTCESPKSDFDQVTLSAKQV